MSNTPATMTSIANSFRLRGSRHPLHGQIFERSPLRAPPNFHNQINVICPVQPPPQKYTASRETQITPTTPAIPSR